MRLWTMVDQNQMDQINNKGFLKADGRMVEKDYKLAYNWLSEQMHKKVGSHPMGGKYPIWAYHQWHDASKPKPDLRSLRYTWGNGGIYYRLQLEVPERHVVLTDYDGWYSVLNHSYYSCSEQDSKDHEKLFKHEYSNSYNFDTFSDELKNVIRESWHRIFDFDYERDGDWVGHTCKDEMTLQATYWVLYKSYIKKIDKFEAKRPKTW